MGDGFGEFDGEAEVVGGGCGPALPGFAEVGAMEAGVDFDAVEGLGVALEVGAFGGEETGVWDGKGPAGGADVDVKRYGELGEGRLHGWRRSTGTGDAQKVRRIYWRGAAGGRVGQRCLFFLGWGCPGG